ncbi:MAG: hypothetical protein GXY67_05975 [Clostridiales bacterium]|nr:hypothetical protein [Clostridiales bacterium]
MEKLGKKLVCILLVLMFVQTAIGVHAEEITPMNTYIALLYAELTVDANGKATAAGIVTANSSSLSCSGTLSILQYKNGAWSTFKSWPTETGTGGLTQSETCTLTAGYKYKTQYSVNVNGEKMTKYSKEKTYN